MNINYKTIEHILDNGLKVLFYNYPGSHSATFMVWYKAGSRNEKVGKTGLAHFLEHLSFKKTDIFDSGQIVAEITRNGGAFNAFTSRDFTCYYETFATKKLELAMIIESQRMSNLILQEDDREKEVGIILSEQEKTLDNPYHSLETAVRSKAYTSHPYRNPIIGLEDDIKAITLDDLYEFYNSYYAPNNASIVVVGNFDQRQTLELIKKHFGKIQPKQISSFIDLEPQQNQLRRARVKKNGSSSIIKLAYHVPSVSSQDMFPIIALGEILNLGISSRAYQALVETQIATDVSVNIEASKDPGLFTIAATLYPGVTHNQAKEKIVDEINKIFTTNPPTKDELEKTKRRITSSFEFNRDGTFKLAYMLGYYETIDSYRFVENYVQNVQNVKIDQIVDVAQKYLIAPNATIGYFMPCKNYKASVPSTHNYEPTSEVKHIYKKPPILMDQKIQSSPVSFAKKTFNNGMRALVSESKVSNTVRLFGTINAGNLYASTTSHVLPVMCAGMLNRGSVGKTKIEIANEVEARGASVGISNVGEAVNFSLSSTAEDFPYVLNMLSKILMEPCFPEDEFDKYKNLAVAGVRQKRDSPAYLAGLAFSQMIYPKDHIFFAHSLNKQEKDLSELNIEDVTSFYNNYYSPHSMIFGISGNIDTKTAFNLIEKNFGHWESKNVPLPLIKQAKMQKKYKEKTICVKGKTEAEVVFGHFGNLSRNDPDFHTAMMMNFILGGSGALSSRIGLKIREDLGLVYSISSSFNALLLSGSWSVRFGVDNKHTDKAIQALKDELAIFIEKGITDSELDLAKSCLVGSYPLKFANNSGIARALLSNEFYGLGDSYLDDYPKIIESITKEDINEAAKKYLHPDLASVVKAGSF